jgi:hypothetical protein
MRLVGSNPFISPNSIRIGSGQLAGFFMCSGIRGSLCNIRANGHGLYSSGTNPGG